MKITSAAPAHRPVWCLLLLLSATCNNVAGQMYCASERRNSLVARGALLDRGNGNTAVAVWGDDSAAQPAFVSTMGAFYAASVSVGYKAVCAITPTGSMQCWGQSMPAKGPPVGQTWTQVFGSVWNSVAFCAIDALQHISCFGSFPVNGAPTGRFVTLSVGTYHACALDTISTMHCWGSNNYGGTSIPTGHSGWLSVSCGLYSTCALNASRALVCWGYDDYRIVSLAPISTPSWLTICDKHFGHICGIRSTGDITCWGFYNAYRAIPSGNSWISVSCGFDSFCAVDVAGALVCWGATPSFPPPGHAPWRLVSSGSANCAIDFAGALFCWEGSKVLGTNSFGELNVSTILPSRQCWTHSQSALAMASSTFVGTTFYFDSITMSPSTTVSFSFLCDKTAIGAAYAACSHASGASISFISSGGSISLYSSSKPLVTLTCSDDSCCWIDASNILSCFGSVQASVFAARDVALLPGCALVLMINGSLFSVDSSTVTFPSLCSSTIENAPPSISPFGPSDTILTSISADIFLSTVVACGITQRNATVCWGSSNSSISAVDASGRLDMIPPSFALNDSVTAVWVGGGRICVIPMLNSSSVYCWGADAAAIDIQLTVMFSIDNLTLPVSLTRTGICASTSTCSKTCLGRPPLSPRSLPLINSSADPPSQLVLSSTHGCTRSSGLSVSCFGLDDSRQVSSAAISSVLKVRVVEGLSCVLTSSLSVACSGSPSFYGSVPSGLCDFDFASLNSLGVLTAGTGTVYSMNIISSLPASTTAISYPTAFEATPLVNAFTSTPAPACVLDSIGSASCYGVNQLPLQAPISSSFIFACATRTFACGLTAAGVISCWGLFQNAPLPVLHLPPAIYQGSFRDLSCGETHVCALNGLLDVICWGPSPDASLLTPNVLPQVVNSNASLVQNGWSSDSMCIFQAPIASSGAIACYSNGFSGIPSPLNLQQPLPSVNGAKVALGYSSACWLPDPKASSYLTCWGDGLARRNGSIPFRPLLSSMVTAVSIGYSHACAVVSGNFLSCWGDGSENRLAFTVGNTPSLISSVSLGFRHTCLLETFSGSLFCVGGSALMPVLIATHLSSPCSGRWFVCGIRRGATVQCFNTSNSDFADISTVLPSAVSNPGGGTIAKLACGEFHVCSISNSSALACGAVDSQNAPISALVVPAATTWRDVSCGRGHTCGIQTYPRRNALICFGDTPWQQGPAKDPAIAQMTVRVGPVGIADFDCQTTAICSTLEQAARSFFAPRTIFSIVVSNLTLSSQVVFASTCTNCVLQADTSAHGYCVNRSLRVGGDCGAPVISIPLGGLRPDGAGILTSPSNAAVVLQAAGMTITGITFASIATTTSGAGPFISIDAVVHALSPFPSTTSFTNVTFLNFDSPQSNMSALRIGGNATTSLGPIICDGLSSLAWNNSNGTAPFISLTGSSLLSASFTHVSIGGLYLGLNSSIVDVNVAQGAGALVLDAWSIQNSMFSSILSHRANGALSTTVSNVSVANSAISGSVVHAPRIHAGSSVDDVCTLLLASNGTCLPPFVAFAISDISFNSCTFLQPQESIAPLINGSFSVIGIVLNRPFLSSSLFGSGLGSSARVPARDTISISRVALTRSISPATMSTITDVRTVAHSLLSTNASFASISLDTFPALSAFDFSANTLDFLVCAHVPVALLPASKLLSIGTISIRNVIQFPALRLLFVASAPAALAPFTSPSSPVFGGAALPWLSVLLSDVIWAWNRSAVAPFYSQVLLMAPIVIADVPIASANFDNVTVLGSGNLKTVESASRGLVYIRHDSTNGASAPLASSTSFSQTEFHFSSVTLTGGVSASDGGGMSISSTGSATRITTISIADSTISHNTAPGGASNGGGIAVTAFDSNVVLLAQQTFFENNTASKNGGGLFVSSTTITDESIVLTNMSFNACTIRGNNASFGNGGGIGVLHDGLLRLHASAGILSSNVAASGSGGGFYHGVATRGVFFTALVKMSSVLASGNVAGGGNGGMASLTSASLSVANVTASNNNASLMGGSIFMISGAAAVSASSFSDDKAGTDGGSLGLVAGSSLHNITSSTFIGSSALSGDGGSILLDSSSSFIGGTTFFGSSAFKRGGGLAVRGLGSSLLLSSSSLLTCSAAHAGGGLSISDGARASIKNTITSNCSISSFADSSSAQGGGGIAIFDSGAPILMSNSSVSFCTAPSLSGGGLFLSSTGDDVTFSSFNVSGCSASLGGGLALLQGSSLGSASSESFVTSNYATIAGGGLYTDDAFFTTSTTDPTFRIVTDGAFRVSGNSAGEYSDNVGSPATQVIDNTTSNLVFTPFAPTTEPVMIIAVVGSVKQVVPVGANTSCTVAISETYPAVSLLGTTSFTSLRGIIQVKGLAFIVPTRNPPRTVEITASCFLPSTSTYAVLRRNITLAQLTLRTTAFPSLLVPSAPGSRYALSSSDLTVSLFKDNVLAVGEPFTCKLQIFRGSAGGFSLVAIDGTTDNAIFDDGFSTSAGVLPIPRFGVQMSAFTSSVTIILACSRPTALVSSLPQPNFTLTADASWGTRFCVLPESTAPVQGSLPPFSVSVFSAGVAADVACSSIGFGAAPIISTYSSALPLVQCLVSARGPNGSSVFPVNGVVNLQNPNGLVPFQQFSILGTQGETFALELTCGFGGYVVIPPILKFSLTLQGCAPGFSAGNLTCTKCGAGVYSVGGLGAACITCPPVGATCDGGLVALLPNYYRPPQLAAIGITTNPELHLCFNGAACIVQENNVTNAFYACAVGYSGPLCGVCDASVNYGKFGSACAPCWSNSSSATLFVFLLIIILSALAYIAGRKTSEKRVSDASVVLRIALSYIQAVGSLKTLKAGGTAAYRDLMGWTDSVSASPLSSGPLQCFLRPSFLGEFMATIGAPFYATGITALFFVLFFALRKPSTAADQSLNPSFCARLLPLLRSRALSNFLFFYFLAYMAITSASFRAFDCRAEDPIFGVVYLREDLRVQCYEGAQVAAVIFAYLTLLFGGLGFPVAVFWILSRASRTQLADPTFRATFGFLFRGYRGGQSDVKQSLPIEYAEPLEQVSTLPLPAVNLAVSSRTLTLAASTAQNRTASAFPPSVPLRAVSSFHPAAVASVSSVAPAAVDKGEEEIATNSAAVRNPMTTRVDSNSSSSALNQRNLAAEASVWTPNKGTRVCSCFKPRAVLSTSTLPASKRPHSSSSSPLASVLCCCCPRLLESLESLVSDDGHALWWESIVLLRKAGLVMIAVLVTDPYYQSAGATLLLLCALGLQQAVRPYEKALFNNLEALSLCSGIITSVVSSILLQYDVTGPLYLSQSAASMPTGQWIATIALAGINIIVMTIFAVLWLLHVWAALPADSFSKPFAVVGRFLRLTSAPTDGTTVVVDTKTPAASRSVPTKQSSRRSVFSSSSATASHSDQDENKDALVAVSSPLRAPSRNGAGDASSLSRGSDASSHSGAPDTVFSSLPAREQLVSTTSPHAISTAADAATISAATKRRSRASVVMAIEEPPAPRFRSPSPPRGEPIPAVASL